MKQLVSVKLFKAETKFCGLCGMDVHDSDGCCRDEVKVVKLVQDQTQIPATIFELPTLPLLAIELSDFIAIDYTISRSSSYFHNHSPPLLSAAETWLKNNVIRI
jgi:hypothetical protein